MAQDMYYIVAVPVLFDLVIIVAWQLTDPVVVRDVADRYQEQQFVAMASIYICKRLLLDVPILFAVKDSADTRNIVLAGVIFLTNTGSLSLVFIPKTMHQREFVPDGVSVGDTIFYKKKK
eukprot:6321437-Ditylum_brightwellii.AAC.1